jgi:ATP-binding cassette subfamily C protein CydCD
VKRAVSYRLGVLYRSLGASDRGLLGGVALAQAVGRVGVVGATAWVAFSGVEHAAVVALALAAVFLVRGALSATLRTHVRSRTLQRLVASLLADIAGVVTEPTDDAELAVMEGLYATEDVLGELVPQALGDALACIVLGAVLIHLEPLTVTLEGVLAVAVGGSIAAVARRFSTTSSEQQWRALLPALDDLSTAIHGRLEIVSNGDAPRFEERLARALGTWRQRSSGGRWLAFLAGRAPVAGAAVVIGLFLLRSAAWRTDALAHVAVLASVTPAFAGVAKGALDLARALVRAGPVVECFESASAATGGTAKPLLPAAIRWEGVSFAYPGARPSGSRAVLTEVDVCWSPGTLLGLAGANGSGKSTFVRILLGLHAPTAGDLRIGDVALSDADPAALRGLTAYLAQRPFLPDRMTVEQAILLLAPDATGASMYAMLARLELLPVLSRRNDAAPLDVKLGALSAGEKQRVAIARALLRDTPLLLLDEPDANLDAAGVALVGRVLREEAKTRMVLVIAHSPALLANADRIVRFDGGRVVTE